MATITDSERHARRLNWIGYANIGLGLFTLFVWAIPGPLMVPSFWQHVEHDFRPQSDPIGAKLAIIVKIAIVAVVVMFWLISAVSLTNGILILKRRRHRACMILSGISLLGTPLNLIVGILSLVTLNNVWARNLFANGRHV